MFFSSCYCCGFLTQKKNGGEKKNGDGGEKKKEESPITVVLKIDIHCDGCATKICKTVRGFEGIYVYLYEYASRFSKFLILIPFSG